MVLNVQKYSMSDIPRMGGGGGGWGARSICGTSTKYTPLGRCGLGTSQDLSRGSVVYVA